MVHKQVIRVGFGVFFMIVFALTIYMVTAIVARPGERSASNKEDLAVNGPKIQVGTIIKEEKEYLCGDREVVFEGPAPSELIGMNLNDLARRYKEQEGWEVNFSESGILNITHHLDEFCLHHKSFRHLGVYDGFLAVYRGPLGNNSKLIRVEKNIPVASLGKDYQERLYQALNFEEQKPELQVLLRKEMEFTSEDSLNAALENLDELGR